MSSRRKPVNAAAFLIIVMTVFSHLSLACYPAEYQIGNECCPKCPAGSRVKTHCNEYTSTSCIPCMGGTYTDKPNGLERCLSCTNCDSGSSLRVKTRCTPTSDTVCEPLEGFYCISYEEDSCGRAQEHRRCKPGQYIRKNGTASRDTECSDCSSGTFSDGTFHSCQPHTQCHLLNLQQITEGTLAADTQCGEKSDHVTVTASITVTLIIIALLILLLIYLKKKGVVFKSRNRKNNTERMTDEEQVESCIQSSSVTHHENKDTWEVQNLTEKTLRHADGHQTTNLPLSRWPARPPEIHTLFAVDQNQTCGSSSHCTPNETCSVAADTL